MRTNEHMRARSIPGSKSRSPGLTCHIDANGDNEEASAHQCTKSATTTACKSSISDEHKPRDYPPSCQSATLKHKLALCLASFECVWPAGATG